MVYGFVVGGWWFVVGGLWFTVSSSDFLEQIVS